MDHDGFQSISGVDLILILDTILVFYGLLVGRTSDTLSLQIYRAMEVFYIIIHTGLLVAKIKSCIPRAL